LGFQKAAVGPVPSQQSADAQLSRGYDRSWMYTGRSNDAVPKNQPSCSERQRPKNPTGKSSTHTCRWRKMKATVRGAPWKKASSHSLCADDIFA